MEKIDDNIIEFEGKRYKLLHDPQMDNYGTEGKVAYYSTARMDNGHECLVTWHTLDDWDGDREEDACDWDNPDKIGIVNRTA